MKMLCQVQLSKHRYKTPEGYLICKDCIIARTGKQTYLKSELFGPSKGEDEYIDVDRKPDQVFDDKTMASFEGKPLTIEHPDVSVSPDNYKELSVGNVYNVRRGRFEDQDVLFADINVYDAEAINLIESGDMEELSCGYDCDITDGPNPEQVNIRGNHVALCEQGRAGIARIQDSKNKPWGAKPVIKDSVQKGTLIQEFGKYAGQYKIVKIQGNVLYCEDVQTKQTYIFKKDKENVDWAIITKADVHDALPSKEEWELMQMGDLTDNKYDITLQHAVEDLRKYPGDSLLGDERAIRMLMSRFNLDKRSVIRYLNYAFDGKVTPKDSNPDKLRQKVKHWTIDLGHDTLYIDNDGVHNIAGNALDHIFNDKVYDSFEEALADAKKLFDGYKDKKEIDDHKYGYYSVSIIEWQNGAGWCVDENGKNIGSMSAFSAYDPKELKGALRDDMRKRGYIPDSEETKYMVYHYSYANGRYTTDADGLTSEEGEKIFKEMVEHFSEFNKNHSYTDMFMVFLDEEDDVYGGKGHIKTAEISEDGKIKEYKEELKKDSFVPLFIISLGENLYLDDNDKPTEDIKKARQFRSKDEAEDHQKTYCNGKVEEVAGQTKDSAPGAFDVQKIEEILQKIDHGAISHDPDLGVIKIDFTDRNEERKAARKLIKEYDIEINEEKDGSLWITVYDKKEELKDSIPFCGRKKEIFDEYSKRFYVKMIETLESKLDKLEKNELLDANQENYEIQKENLRKELQKQIDEYKEKVNA